MKLSAIKRCCVEEKEFYIYESDCGEQWIGTHTAAWPVEGDLKLTEGSIAAIFDLAPKKAAQMDILALPLGSGSRLYVAPAVEWDAQELGIVEYLGERCLLLTCRGRMLAVDMAKVKAALAARGKALTIRVKEGDTIVRVDPRYFRPTEVETLLGDPAKAQAKLDWAPRTTFEEMVQEMARYDLELALRDAVVEDAGFTSFKHEE